MREWRRAVAAVLRLAFAADRRRAWFAVVAWPICGVLGTFSSLWLKLLVDGAASGDRRQVLVAAGLVAVGASVSLSGFFISLTAMTRVREEVDREIDQRLIALIRRRPRRRPPGEPGISRPPRAAADGPG